MWEPPVLKNGSPLALARTSSCRGGSRTLVPIFPRSSDWLQKETRMYLVEGLEPDLPVENLANLETSTTSLQLGETEGHSPEI